MSWRIWGVMTENGSPGLMSASDRSCQLWLAATHPQPASQRKESEGEATRLSGKGISR